MSAFSPILYDNNKPVVNICKNEELGDDIIVYKKVNFDGNDNYLNQSNYFNQDGTENKNPGTGNVVYKKLGKSNQNQEVNEDKDFPSDTYYIRNDDKYLLEGGRKPKRLSYLSKKRNMKSRRVRKSRRRYSRRKY